MIIEMDTREKAHATVLIKEAFTRAGIQFVSTKLYVADYRSLENPKFVIDRKRNLEEIYENLCHGEVVENKVKTKKKRLKEEAKRAHELGIKMVVLCEHGGSIKCLEDVKSWSNPRLKISPYAWDGNKLYREMLKFAKEYDIDFVFCSKKQTGRRIIELLEQGNAER